jgi:hypothetical protein
LRDERPAIRLALRALLPLPYPEVSMSRVAKSDVNSALKLVASSIIKAAGGDGRVSRADVQAALKTMPKAQRPLADIFFKFVDHRDFKTGAQVTAKDVNRAVAYARTHMVEKYDLNNNGLSKDEVAKMSLTGKRAVDLARALKGAAAPDDGGRLTTSQLGAAIGKLAPKANYVSESDHSPEWFSASFPAGHDLTGHNVMTALTPRLEKFFETGAGRLFDEHTAEVYSARDARAFIKGLGEVAADDDVSTKESARAFAEITRLINANLTDVHVVKVGPKDDRTGELATDQGLYAKMIVGRTADGKLAGVVIGAVET